MRWASQQSTGSQVHGRMGAWHLHQDRAGPAAQPPAHLALLLRVIVVRASVAAPTVLVRLGLRVYLHTHRCGRARVGTCVSACVCRVAGTTTIPYLAVMSAELIDSLFNV